MYNFSKHKATGNQAIDFCANLIACARENNKPVKTLYLSKVFYAWFVSGMKILITHSDAENKDELINNIEKDECLSFDSVSIKKGSQFQMKPVIVEYYEMIKAEA